MNAQKELVFNSLSPFVDALLSSGIRAAVAAVIDEKRTIETSSDTISVENINTAAFIAYKDSTIFKLTVSGEMIDGVESILGSHGITVTRRSRNITR